MKKILLASVTVLSLAAPTFAQTAENGLPKEIRDEVSMVAPGVDFAALTPQQVTALSMLSQNKANGTVNADDRAAYIRVVLGWQS